MLPAECQPSLLLLVAVMRQSTTRLDWETEVLQHVRLWPGQYRSALRRDRANFHMLLICHSSACSLFLMTSVFGEVVGHLFLSSSICPCSFFVARCQCSNGATFRAE
jgi:transglutaminase-like putative cysteine protease